MGEFLLLSVERRSGCLPEHSSWTKCNRDRFIYEYVEVSCQCHSTTASHMSAIKWKDTGHINSRRSTAYTHSTQRTKE